MATPTFILPSAPTYTEGFVNGLNVYPDPTNFVANQVPFTRATTATRTNAAGLIELVPYNLLQYSEQFDNAAWSKTGATITANSITSPSGVQNADTITQSGATINIFQSINIVATGNYTYSVYLKKGNFDSSSPFRFGVFRGTDLGYITFNFATNTTSVISGTFVSHSATSVGNGWYLIQYTINIPTTGNANFYNGGVGGNIGTGNFFYSWGAQLIEGTAALPYQLTETRLNRPRVDFSLGGCPNLLLEPQRTNVLLNTIFSGSGSTPTSWTQPVATGTSVLTTSTLGVGVQACSQSATLQRPFLSQSFTLLANTTYSYSIYVESISGGLPNENILLASGLPVGATVTYIANGATVSSSATAVVGRLSIVIVVSVLGGSTAFRCGIGTSANSTGSILFSRPQLETGAYPTTHIPTTTTSVTRNTDTFQLSNIYANDMIGPLGGTFIVDLRNNKSLARDAYSALGVGDSTTLLTNALVIIPTIGASRYRVGKYIAGVYSQLYITTSDTAKIAIKWNGATADVFENGVKVVSATAFTTTIMQNLSGTFGVPTYLNSMALYNTPISDAECIQITTL